MDANEMTAGLPDGWRIVEQIWSGSMDPVLVLQRMVERKRGIRRRVELVWEDRESKRLWWTGYATTQTRDKTLGVLRAYAWTQVNAEKFMMQERARKIPGVCAADLV